MRRFFLISLMAALALTAVSCSKSSSSNPFNPAAAEVAAQAGDQALANQDLTGADAHYKDALAKDPGNPHANLGAAITGLGLLQQDPGVDSLLTFIGSVPLPAPGARAARSSRLLAHLGLPTAMRYDPLSNGRGLAKLLMRGAQDPILFSWYQRVIRNRIMPRLQYAEDRLNVLESHPSFIYLVPTNITGLDFPLEVDLGEALALDAVVNSLQGVLGTLVAYDFDALPGATPTELLNPAGTFGNLRTDGAAQLAAARANLRIASSRMVAMDAAIRAEIDDQSDDVIPAAALDEQGFKDVEAAFAQMEAALTGTVYYVDVKTWDNRTVVISLSAGNFFSTPIADWKTKIPHYTINFCGDVVLDDPLTFPDATFNGLFPGMTSAILADIIGPVTPPSCIPLVKN